MDIESHKFLYMSDDEMCETLLKFFDQYIQRLLKMTKSIDKSLDFFDLPPVQFSYCP
jgi:hypothetical protein